MEHCKDCIFFKECNKIDYVCPCGKRLLIVLQETKEEVSSTLQKLIAKGEVIEIKKGEEVRYALPSSQRDKKPYDGMFI